MTDLRAHARDVRAGWLALVAIALLLCGLALAAVTPLAIEDDWLMAVVESPGLTPTAHMVTFLGELWFVVVVAAIVAVLVRHRPEAPRLHLLLVLGIGGSTVIVAVLKLVVARARPEMALVSTWTPAYPSGHAVRAAAGYGLVVWACQQYLRHVALRLAGTAVAVTGILAIAWSRIQLAVHLPSDVVVGLLIGAIWLLAVLRAVPPPATLDGAERHRRAETARPVTGPRDHLRPTADSRRSHTMEDADG